MSRKRRYRQPRVSRKHRKGPIPNRVDISERPEEIENRETFGHWEGDLILFKETRSNLITLRERNRKWNRQLRRDLPRETTIDEYSQEQIDDIVNCVNNRPLKILGYKTPAEVLLESTEKN